MVKQAEFDIDSLIREADIAAGPAWEGAPLHYQEDYYSPAALDAAWERWSFENGSFGCIPRSHMWYRESYRQYPTLIGSNSSDHQLDLFSADARCDGKRFGHVDHTHAPGEIPEATYRAYRRHPSHCHRAARWAVERMNHRLSGACERPARAEATDDADERRADVGSRVRVTLQASRYCRGNLCRSANLRGEIMATVQRNAPQRKNQ